MKERKKGRKERKKQILQSKIQVMELEDEETVVLSDTTSSVNLRNDRNNVQMNEQIEQSMMIGAIRPQSSVAGFQTTLSSSSIANASSVNHNLITNNNYSASDNKPNNIATYPSKLHEHVLQVSCQLDVEFVSTKYNTMELHNISKNHVQQK
jgi:hypothetical protein